MKYVIKGVLPQVAAVEITTEFTYIHDEQLSIEIVEDTFESMMSTYNSLKPTVDKHGGYINWHECSHGDDDAKPCVIADEYRGGQA